MTMPPFARRTFITGVLSGLFAAACRSKSDAPAAEEAIGPLLAPASLATRVDEIKNGRVTVIYVGPDALFARGHVPGARKVPAVESDEGRRALAELLGKVPLETEIVLYCGCCPVKSCPNIRPASAALRALGRPNAFVLDLPTRFSADWTDKGYPVERS